MLQTVGCLSARLLKVKIKTLQISGQPRCWLTPWDDWCKAKGRMCVGVNEQFHPEGFNLRENLSKLPPLHQNAGVACRPQPLPP